MGEPCVLTACRVDCALADGTRCSITDAVNLRVKLLDFTWKFEFKILQGGGFPVILGLDFLTRTLMNVKVASRQFCFNFAPERTGTFGVGERSTEEGQYLRSVWNEFIESKGAPQYWQKGWTGILSEQSSRPCFHPNWEWPSVRLMKSSYRIPHLCALIRIDVPRQN
jgi:hypothetical protein